MRLHRGKLVDWKDKEGYGFIADNINNKKIFVHIKAFNYTPSRRPAIGDVVSYIIENNGSKLQAIKVGFINQASHNVNIKNTFIDNKNKTHKTNPFPIFFLIIIYISLLFYSIIREWLPTNILPFFIILNFITFFIYWWDKSASGDGLRRTSENTLHILAILGGWIGAYIAQKTLRHKSVKKEFQTTFKVSIIFNYLILIVYSYFVHIS